MSFRTRPWLLPTLTMIVICVAGLSSGGRKDSVIDAMYWVGLVLIMAGGVLSERGYRRTRREQRR